MSCHALEVSVWCMAGIRGSYVWHGRIFVDDLFFRPLSWLIFGYWIVGYWILDT